MSHLPRFALEPVRTVASLLAFACLGILKSQPIAASQADTTSSADLYTLLGPLQLTRVGSHTKNAFGAGTKARLVNTQTDSVTFEIDHQRYDIPREEAKYYFEAGDTGAKFLLGEAMTRIKDPADLLHPSCVNVPKEKSCPEGHGEPWNDDAARRTALLCPIEPVEIVRRTATLPFSETCRNDIKPLKLTTPTTWQSCPSPPTCSPEQAALSRKQNVLRKENEQLHCHGKPRAKQTLQTEAKCMVPFEKPITKLVIHQTDAPMDRGPNDIFNWHRDRGFEDVSYHYIIAKDAAGAWRVFEGRPRGFIGAHGGPGANDDSLGIAIAGCFRTAAVGPTAPCKADQDRPPAEAVRLLTNLVAKLKTETLGPDGKPSIKEIIGHGQHRFAQTGCHTNCPSPACQMLVNRLEERFFGGTP